MSLRHTVRHPLRRLRRVVAANVDWATILSVDSLVPESGNQVVIRLAGPQLLGSRNQLFCGLQCVWVIGLGARGKNLTDQPGVDVLPLAQSCPTTFLKASGDGIRGLRPYVVIRQPRPFPQ